MKPKHIILFVFIAFVFGLTACSGGGGDNSTAASSPPPAVVTGSAVKGPVQGAQVNLFYFDNSGYTVVIPTTGSTVETDSNGAFSFPVDGQDLMGITSPLIVYASGGSMVGSTGSVATPGLVLMAVIADPLPLTFSQVNLTCHLSVASTIAAHLLINEAVAIGTAPTRDDAEWFMDLVESQLQLGLADDPADQQTLNGMFNYCIDQNLGLGASPPDNTDELVMDLIEYFVANLSSQSGILDEWMDDPTDPGTDIAANFTSFGMGVDDLSSLVDGPQDFIIMTLASDVEYVENDGADTASITASLMDATGAPYQDLDPVQMGLDGGPGVLLDAGTSVARGEVRGTLASDQTGDTGEIVVRTDFTLPHYPNTISLNIAVQAVDFYIDTDGDGFSDGDEVLGWKCVIDEVGYGSLANGTLLTTRSVTSDPNVYDTDNDGLSDYEEYTIQTDPRAIDTDGDGLTDYEEWNTWISNPSSVDTDGDARGPNQDLAPASALFDGQELVLFNTSPTLSDTDADGKTDFEEVDHPFRSPLISDLPKLELEIVDAVDVRLDVTYAEETGSSFQYGSELTKSTTATTSQYNENSINLGVEVGYSFTAGLFPKGSVSTKLSFDYGHKWSTTQTSSNTAQQSHSEYTTDSRTRTETAATGSMSAGIRLRNPSDITYTMSKLGITVRHWELNWDEDLGQLVKSFQTVATLVPSLGTGFTLAPDEETPVLQVAATDLNPDRVKELLRRPDSLYIETAYFELENAEQVNFDYLTEVNAAQTAGIIIDPGESNAKEYRVATNVQRGFGGTYPGVTLGTILNDILEIDYTTIEHQQLEPASPTNERVLFSLQGLATDLGNPDQNFWVVIHESEHPSSGLYDFDEVPIRAGDRVLLIYVRGKNGEGLYAPEEQHYGIFVEGATDPDSDYDGDGLTDYDEVRVGWQVTWTDASGTPHTYWVLSDPTSRDQDGDGLNDYEELNGLTGATNPSSPDTDHDGIIDSEDPWPLYQAKVLYVDQDASGNNNGSSWTDAYDDLQLALTNAQAGFDSSADATDDVSEIWVADGIYKPHETDVTAYFRVVSTVGLYGGFSGGEIKRSQRNEDPRTNDTILSGDLGVPGDFADNSLTVVRVAGRTDEAVNYHIPDYTWQSGVIDGFQISGGNSSTMSGDMNEYRYAGGMFVAWGPVTLRNLMFADNWGKFGAALQVRRGGWPDTAGVQMIGCVFSGNKCPEGSYGGAVHLGDDAVVTIDNSRFIANAVENGGFGAAIYSQSNALNIKDTDFLYNDAATTSTSNFSKGGALELWANTDTTIERCRFIGNRAVYSGGAIYVGGNPGNTPKLRVVNSLFRQNEVIMPVTSIYSGGGGAIYADVDARLSVINCTIVENKCYFDGSVGGGICVHSTPYPDSMIVENSIFWDNEADCLNDLGYYGDSAVAWAQVGVQNGLWYDRVINASCLEGLGPIRFKPRFGLDCIWEDPQLKDAGGLVELDSESPCIDTGNTFVDADPLLSGYQALPVIDLAGAHRIVDGDDDGIADVDMGAYEYQP